MHTRVNGILFQTSQRTPSQLLHGSPGQASIQPLAKRYFQPAVFALAALVMVGCPARWKLVFVNGTEQRIRIEVSSAVTGSTSSFTLAPDASHTVLESHAHHLAVFDSAGSLFFSDENPQINRTNLHAKYPHLYVLVTTTNIYPIPEEFRKSWRSHIGEITSQN